MGFQSFGVPDAKSEWLRGELARDERVIWAAEPTPRYFTKETVPGFLFAIPWTAFALFWIGGAYAASSRSHDTMARAFPAFGIPFVLIGLGLLSQPFWARRRLSRSVYAITDRRALIIDHDFRDTRRVQSFAPTEFSSIEKELRSDGTGDVFFASRETPGKNGPVATKVGFVNISDVRAAEAALQEIVTARSAAE